MRWFLTHPFLVKVELVLFVPIKKRVIRNREKFVHVVRWE